MALPSCRLLWKGKLLESRLRQLCDRPAAGFWEVPFVGVGAKQTLRTSQVPTPVAGRLVHAIGILYFHFIDGSWCVWLCSWLIPDLPRLKVPYRDATPVSSTERGPSWMIPRANLASCLVTLYDWEFDTAVVGTPRNP
jgi:hypothetical protein